MYPETKPRGNPNDQTPPFNPKSHVAGRMEAEQLAWYQPEPEVKTKRRDLPLCRPGMICHSGK